MPQAKAQTKPAGSPYYRRNRQQASAALTNNRKSKSLPFKHRVPFKKATLYLVLLCSALVLLVWLQIQIDTVSGRVRALRQEINDRQSNNNYARSELEKATTFDVVFPIVNSKYAMDFPEVPKVVLQVPEEIISGNK